MGGNVDKVRAIHEVLMGPKGAIRDAPEEVALIAEVLRQVAEPQFECAMIGPDESFQNVERGTEGFFSAWTDWLSPFEEFRIEVERTIDAGEDVVDLVRQVARTVRGGVPVETEGAAVWRFRSGRLQRVEFHLDRAAALRIAGLEPPAP
jgi:ketosteroid isomerase-like protein